MSVVSSGVDRNEAVETSSQEGMGRSDMTVGREYEKTVTADVVKNSHGDSLRLSWPFKVHLG